MRAPKAGLSLVFHLTPFPQALERLLAMVSQRRQVVRQIPPHQFFAYALILMTQQIAEILHPPLIDLRQGIVMLLAQPVSRFAYAAETALDRIDGLSIFPVSREIVAFNMGESPVDVADDIA